MHVIQTHSLQHALCLKHPMFATKPSTIIFVLHACQPLHCIASHAGKAIDKHRTWQAFCMHANVLQKWVIAQELATP